MDKILSLTVVVIVLVLLSIVMFSAENNIGDGIKRILGLTDKWEYCESTDLNIEEFSKNLEARLSRVGEAKQYYQFHVNEGCFKDPKDIMIEEAQKCNFFCQTTFNVDDGTKRRITKFCNGC